MRLSLSIRFIPFLFILFSYSILASTPSSPKTNNTDSLNGYLKLYEELIHLQPDPEKYTSVDDFTFKRDVARFHLQTGDLFFCKPVQGRICAAVFIGEGIFDFTPPTKIERDHLYRFFEKDSVHEKFNFLFIMFADNTFEEFQNKFSFSENVNTKDHQKLLDYALQYVGKEKEKTFNYDVVKSLLDGDRNYQFYAHFSDEKINPMFLRIDPFEEEEVRFMRRPQGESVTYTREVISQFHKQRDYQSGKDLSDENNQPLDVVSYRIDAKIEDNLDFSAQSTINFRSRKNNQHWIYFWMHPELKVDSVLWKNGRKSDQPDSVLAGRKKIPFTKGKESTILWVECPLVLSKDDTAELSVYYHGDVIERDIDWIYLKSINFWYPRHSTRDKSLFDITFQTPLKYQFACAGVQQSADTTGNVVTSRWIIPRPARGASFNIGIFEKYSIKTDTVPEITVFMAQAAHDYMRRTEQILFSRNMDEDVAVDVAKSMSFFKKVFGDYPVEKFYATEIPYTHGQAFPGLIDLTWLTFLSKNEEGTNQIFRAHEVAHQWWGIGVDFKTYHDQWLSEGFSHFAGLWYMQQKLEDEEKYYKVLKDWGKEIMDNRKFLFTTGQEAGPIWLGNRTYSSSTQGDYNLIIYKKSAWVLHMLRTMLMDLETQSDSTFIAMMRDFYQSYLYKSASTEDFRRTVAKYFDSDMKWFFDQWIYNVDIPKYKYSYKVDELSDGKYSLKLRVRQEEVSVDFQMPVLLKIEFDGDEERLERLVVTGKESDFEFLDLDKKPKDVEFNAMESALCKVDKEGW